MDVDACRGAHCGLDGLGTECVGRVRAANEVRVAQPVGGADHGAEITGILHAVEGNHPLLSGIGATEIVFTAVEDGNHLGRRL